MDIFKPELTEDEGGDDDEETCWAQGMVYYLFGRITCYIIELGMLAKQTMELIQDLGRQAKHYFT